jgi:enoyl-CoA hydratase/carnithine racemase
MGRQSLREETQDFVRTLVFDRPEARNAFDAQQYRLLTGALDRAADDDLVKVVILTGAGEAFTAGQDLAEMALPAAGATGGEHPFGACLDRVIGFDKPLLAAVNGVGVGLGLTILLHCDVVFIAKGARLRVPFVSLGVVPEAASGICRRCAWVTRPPPRSCSRRTGSAPNAPSRSGSRRESSRASSSCPS